MPDEKPHLKVFICYAHADELPARRLHSSMRKRGIDPWLDEIDLLPGQRSEEQIQKALDRSDAIVVCLSKNAVDEKGVVQKGIRVALDKALEMPEESIFLIPARFEESATPYSLKHYRTVDLFKKDGYLKLMKALKKQAAQLERATVRLPKENETNPNALKKAAIRKTILALTAQPPVEEPVKTKAPAIAPKKEPKKPSKPDAAGNITAVGNHPVGDRNPLPALTVQPSPEKPAETKPPVIAQKKESQKPVLPPPARKKEPVEQHHNLRINTIIGAVAIVIIVACLTVTGFLTWFIMSGHVSTATSTPAFIFTDTPVPPGIQAPADTPTLTSTLTPIPTYTLIPTSTETPVVIASVTQHALVSCTWTQKEQDVPPFLHNTCLCTEASCTCHKIRDWYPAGIAPVEPPYTYPSRKQVDHWVLEYGGSCQ
jgi:hypothetical protein